MSEQETGDTEEAEAQPLDENSNEAAGPPLVTYPQVSGINWPSYLLQVWLTLHRIGVPEKNLRFLPEIGHFALPEVMEEEPGEDWERHSPDMEMRHPRSALYDPASQRATGDKVDPQMARPRLKVNVRTDTYWKETFGTSAADNLTAQQVGRLAHFVEPLLAGLPSLAADSEARTESSGSETVSEDMTAAENEVPRDRLDKPLARLTPPNRRFLPGIDAGCSCGNAEHPEFAGGMFAARPGSAEPGNSTELAASGGESDTRKSR